MAIALLVLLVLPVVGVLLALRAGGGAAPVRSAATPWRLLGLGGGVAAAVLVERSADLGRGTMLAVPVVALGLLVGVAVGESRRHAPPPGPRAASLQVRRVRDHLPPALAAAVAVALGGLVLLLVTGVLLGSPDDLGRAGRTLAEHCSDGTGHRHGPWPGSFYAVPLAAVLAGGLAASWLAARAVVRRPLRVGADAPEPGAEADRASRRASVTDVVAALGVLVAVPLAGVATTSAASLHAMQCRPASWTALLWLAVVLGVGALGLLVASTAVLLRPRTATARRAVHAGR